MAYVISERAADDIYWLYESGKREFGEWAANAYLDLLRHAVEFASAYPGASPSRKFVSGPVRTKYFGSHLIVYEMNDLDIVVLRVFHQSQDWQNEPFQ
ncbi:type II toxin-antitoxin system RelE/ParE family toxin [Devosia sp.]|uniref:type II toxin-antitoxin system RelE/ParE family toxin n=1 Tax=Devosia sp. TaxID=1871048 RepID=UPI003263A013